VDDHSRLIQAPQGTQSKIGACARVGVSQGSSASAASVVKQKVIVPSPLHLSHMHTIYPSADSACTVHHQPITGCSRTYRVLQQAYQVS
jgi:hypothetical protein